MYIHTHTHIYMIYHIKHWLVYNSAALYTFTMLYNHPRYPSSNLFIIPNRNAVPIQQLHMPPCPSPWSPLLYFLSLYLCLSLALRVNGIRLVLWWLADITQYNVF